MCVGRAKEAVQTSEGLATGPHASASPLAGQRGLGTSQLSSLDHSDVGLGMATSQGCRENERSALHVTVRTASLLLSLYLTVIIITSPRVWRTE